MAKYEEFNQISKKIIDMLVDTTLKKHDVKLEADKIAPETKDELRELVQELQKSVHALTQQQKDENE